MVLVLKIDLWTSKYRRPFSLAFLSSDGIMPTSPFAFLDSFFVSSETTLDDT